jgi:sulfofructose kinase
LLERDQDSAKRRIIMSSAPVDVLCVGAAGYDFTFAVPHHPDADEKLFAETLVESGGGPAANAAVAIARLGYRAAFAGTLGQDLYGERHLAELTSAGVDIMSVRRVAVPTPLSAIVVKPDGARTVISYGNQTAYLQQNALDLSEIRPSAILFDGHEPRVSPTIAREAAARGLPTVLDAGSVHQGTLALLPLVTFAVCSSKFAATLAGSSDKEEMLQAVTTQNENAVITLGDQGVIWRTPSGQGALPAFRIDPVDTTGAGDAFHGAFAAGLAAGLSWDALLRFASAVAALCCMRLGARPGLPDAAAVARFLAAQT